MSELSKTEESGVVLHNSYFDGRVQSLGLQTERGRATLGVMKKGTYRFAASAPEQMVILSGSANVRLSGGESLQFDGKGVFDVAADTAFDIVCATDVAYLCYYG